MVSNFVVGKLERLPRNRALNLWPRTLTAECNKGRGTGAALHMKYLPTSGNAFDVNPRVCREVSLLALFIVNTELVLISS